MFSGRNIAAPASAWAGVLMFLAFFSTPFPASAQTSTATLTGTVRDSSGAFFLVSQSRLLIPDETRRK